jgi:hypothetical protein
VEGPDIDAVPAGSAAAPAPTAIGDRAELDQIFLSIAAVGQLTIGCRTQRSSVLPRR